MLAEIALFQAQYPWLMGVYVFAIGSAIGSFINVVVYRLPIMLSQDWQTQAIAIIDESIDAPVEIAALKFRMPSTRDKFNLVFPRSSCPHCDVAIKPWHNIPIIGYLLIRGKCANCKAAVSARYPIVELFTGILSLCAWVNFGFSAVGGAALVLTWVLICLALIDFDTQLLPDDITLPVMWLGLIVNYFGIITSFDSAFFGAITGYLVLWTVYQIFKLITGKEGMGFGDFKMLAMLGAWLGMISLPLIILLSSLTGAILGGALIILGRDKSIPIKFGPFLAAAGWIALMWGDDILQTYLEMTTVIST